MSIRSGVVTSPSMKRQPSAGRAHGTAAQHTHEQAEHEDGLFEILGIGQGAQDWPQHGGDHRDHRACIAPVGQIVHLAHTAGLRQRIEEDGHQGCNHQHKGRVAHIVQDPRTLQRRDLKFFLLHSCSSRTAVRCTLFSQLSERQGVSLTSCWPPLRIPRRCGHRPCPTARPCPAFPHRL